MSSHLILWPVIILALVTLSLYLCLFFVRIRLIKSGEAQLSDFKTYEQEAAESRKWSRALTNQYETPVLFYAACAGAALINGVDGIMLTLAWLYVAFKTAHVFVHVTSNRLRHRQRLFSCAFFILILQWLWLAIHLIGQ